MYPKRAISFKKKLQNFGTGTGLKAVGQGGGVNFVTRGSVENLTDSF